MWGMLSFLLVNCLSKSRLFSLAMLLVLCFSVVKEFSFFPSSTSELYLDKIGGFLFLLSAAIVFLCQLLNFSFSLNLLLLSLSLFFFSKKLILFYMSFELSIIPAFKLIYNSGKTPERMNALKFLIAYTLMGSLPFIYKLLSNIYELGSIQDLFFYKTGKFKELTILFFVLAFLMKLPLMGLHKWLPKAHVEAPTVGSMILAALLLKMGAYGLYRLSFLSKTFKKMLMGWMMVFLVLVSFICYRITDLKKLVAYSSMKHMLLVAFSWTNLSQSSLVFSLILSVSHGFISSGLFLMVGQMYASSSSRSILFNLGYKNMFSLFQMAWFLLLILNCSAPTSLSLFSEIFLIHHLISNLFSKMSSVLFVFFSGLYCMYLYMLSFHGDYSFQKENQYFSKVMFLSVVHVIVSFLFIFMVVKVF